MSSELLLRLFNSDYFSPHLALSYLKTYSENIGITYYLVERLKNSFEPEDVEFYWPQLCHLLITKPSDSLALENFVIGRCTESVHVAMVTLWHFQAARYDLAANPSTASFQTCKRMINKCQSILFDDAWSFDPGTPMQIDAPGASTSKAVSRWNFGAFFGGGGEHNEVHPANMATTLIGMGSIAGSVPGVPSLVTIGGPMAIQQGRKPPPEEFRKALARIEDDGDELEGFDNEGDEIIIEEDEDEAEGHTKGFSNGSTSSGKAMASSPQSIAGSASLGTAGAQAAEAPKTPASSASDAPPSSTPSGRFASFTSKLNDISNRAAAAVGDAIGQTFQIVGPPSPQQTIRTSSGQGFGPNTKRRPPMPPAASAALRQQSSNSASVPNLVRRGSAGPSNTFASSSAALANYQSRSSSSVELLIQAYPPQTRSRLLRIHYSRTQTNFLANLQDISARLLILPKPARLSALRHELTQLNHTLPQEVCFPLWCQCQRDVYTGPAVRKDPATLSKTRHHRVVRIDPSEAVVLNSADRVPYLLHVEVLNNDLDFDPDRRSNREVTKKLIAQEEDHRRRARRRADLSDSTYGAHKDSQDGPLPRAPQQGKTNGDSDSITNGPATALAAEARGVDVSRTASSIGHDGVPSRSVTPSLQPQEADGDISAMSSSSAAPVSADESTLVDEGEGVDLTEQAYGEDLARFGGDDDGSDDDDIAAMNRTYDAAAWTSRRRSSQIQRNGGSAQTPDSPTLRRKEFSLDDYSERMRTAAIMLAQLNRSTNAAAHPIVSHQPHVTATAQGGWSSWIVGTSWARGSANPTTPQPQQSEAGQGSVGISATIKGITSPPGTPITPATAGVDAPVTPNTPSMAMGGGSGAGAGRLMPADAEGIRKRIMQEMMALEEERMSRTKASARKRSSVAATVGSGIEDEATVLRAVNKDDPSAAHFRESWTAKKARIRASSPYGHLPNWDVFSVIIKTGADLRQEQLAVQLINEFGRIWDGMESGCWVRYFRILVTSENSGLMETITDAISIHSIKKEAYSTQVGGESIATYSLMDHFLTSFGHPNSPKFLRAQDCFMRSLAGYSIISYLLQLKDRHNGNILVDSDGHLIHIDFGFMLGISPGGVGFEAAPFKMPQEYIDILGGMDSPKFEEFRKLMRQGFKDIRRDAERIIMMVELMQSDSKLPCFMAAEAARNLRNRFQLGLSASQCDDFVDQLILNSAGSAFTRLYDQFQYYSQGIL